MKGIRKKLRLVCALVLSLTLIAVSGINICAGNLGVSRGMSVSNSWGVHLDGKLDRIYYMEYPLCPDGALSEFDSVGTAYFMHDRYNLYVLVSLDCKRANLSSEQCEKTITAAIDWANNGESASYYTVNFPDAGINGKDFEYAIRDRDGKFNVEYKIPLQCRYDSAKIGFDVEVKYIDSDGKSSSANIYDSNWGIPDGISKPECFDFMALWEHIPESFEDPYFLDVSGEHDYPYPWYYASVKYCFRNSLMIGVSDDYFAPDMEMSRAMFAQVLYNMEGKPDVSAYENKFTDVREDDWFYNAVLWASNNGVVAGTSDTTCSPNESITREQLVEMVYRYASAKKYDVTASADIGTFKDSANVSQYAEDALKWSVGAGIILGSRINGEILLDPKGNATRAQVAMILEHFCEKVAK